MKKRELLIIVGFVAAACVAYYLMAPPPAESERRLSVSNVVDSIRRRVASNAAHARMSHDGTLPVGEARELRIGGTNELTVVGEARDDIAYTLEIEANAPSEGEAQERAKRAGLKADNLGDVLSLTVDDRRTALVISRLSLRVPAGLDVRIESLGSTKAAISGVGSAEVDATGDVRLGNIARGVTGNHRNGTLVVDQAGSVNVTLVASDATFRHIDGEIRVNGRNGRSRVESSRGPVAFEETNHVVTIVEHEGRVEVNGTGGTIEVTRPRDAVNLYTRRARVDLTLDRGVPVMAMTTDLPLTLLLDGTPSIAIDAEASEGRIEAKELGLTAATTGGDATLAQRLDGGDAHVALRARRGVIVLRKAK